MVRIASVLLGVLLCSHVTAFSVAQASTVKKSIWTRLNPVSGAKERTREELRDGISNFYDKSSGLWEEMWGDHMHHGYYETKPKSLAEHQKAQVEMIDRSLEWAGVGVNGSPAPEKGLDVGCGIGGSSRHIARKFGTVMKGITLSPVQRNRAEVVTEAAGLAEKCSFEVVDALNQPFESNSFDLIWSMESGEHMPEKREFVKELARVCKPGGKILIVTWCHRDLEEGEDALTSKEESLLEGLQRAYFLPKWCSVADYVTYCNESGLEGIRRADWTEYIQYFWPAVIRSSLTGRGIWGLIKAGPSTIRGAIAMLLMVRGFKTGLIKFGLITAEKPLDAPAV